MGIAAVDGYGLITSSNAKEIYTKWKKGEVELNTSQQKRCESFLTSEEIDDITYETGGAKKTGEDKISDKEKADSHGGQGGNAVATTAGNIAVVVGMAALLPALDGFSTLAFSLVCMGLGLVQMTIAKLFDNGYKDRTGACDNADGTNSTIDSYSSALTDTMDQMNEDMDTYQQQSDEYTLAVNENTSAAATLQVDLADAQAAGDTARVKSIKEQMAQLQKTDMSDQQEGLDETKSKLEEYQTANDESAGVKDAGQSVSDFLKEGTALGVVAGLNAAIDAAAAIAFYIGFTAATPKLPFGVDIPSNIAGKITGAAAATAFLGAAYAWGNKAVKEFECASKGGDMQEHVNTLNDMIGQQSEYIGTTGETFDATDEASEESQSEAQEAAGKAVDKGTAPKKKKKDDEDDTPAGSPTAAGGATTGAGSAAA